MKQYCRYCSGLVVGDAVYCGTKGKVLSERTAKSLNSCKAFDFNPIDAFDINRRYKPQKREKNDNKPLKGQMSIDDLLKGEGP